MLKKIKNLCEQNFEGKGNNMQSDEEGTGKESNMNCK